MARKARKPYWWHVPLDAWAPATPVGGHLGNTGNDVFLVLVDSEEAAALENDVVPEHDEFVIERVIGQWHMRMDLAVGANFYVHERCYVVPSTAGTIALRNLTDAAEADTSFLYHNVTGFTANQNADAWGNWLGARPDLPDNALGSANQDPRGLYARDVRVGRRLEEGEALVWHWQLRGTVVPADDLVQVKCWFRTLVRQG